MPLQQMFQAAAAGRRASEESQAHLVWQRWPDATEVALPSQVADLPLGAPAIQRDSDPPESPDSSEPTDGAPVTTAAPAATAAPTTTSGADLDELARRLYEPLTARLRAELCRDRERSGRSITR